MYNNLSEISQLLCSYNQGTLSLPPNAHNVTLTYKVLCLIKLFYQLLIDDYKIILLTHCLHVKFQFWVTDRYDCSYFLFLSKYLFASFCCLGTLSSLFLTLKVCKVLKVSKENFNQIKNQFAYKITNDKHKLYFIIH